VQSRRTNEIAADGVTASCISTRAWRFKWQNRDRERERKRERVPRMCDAGADGHRAE